METFTVPGAADGVQLSTLVIAPERPKAVLQLVHGMAEHKERYIPVMNYLSEAGYACVICDLRGHGATVKDKEDLGWLGKGGMRALVDDVHCVTDWAKAKYPGLPVFLFGHSMGSMIVRSFLKRYDKDIAGLIVWDIIHSAFIRPFTLVGVLRNYIQSGINEIPTEEAFKVLDGKSAKFKKLHQEAA